MIDQQADEVLPQSDPAASAKAADLYYVSDEEPGFRRQRWGRGFTYFDSSGQRIQDDKLRARFEALAIPPAWTDVWICIRPKGHIQATGRDAKGRKQYIYHPRWEEVRNLTKFNRLLHFSNCLPMIRAQVDQDLRLRKLSRRKVVAIVVRLLETTLIRIGNREYTQRNNTFGLTTLRDRHLDIEGARLKFEFKGKSGKYQAVDIRDRRLARLVKRCQELPGQHLFQYFDENGERQAVTSTDVNEYLHHTTSIHFTAKDFRTWGGTVLAASELYHLGYAACEKERDKRVVAAVKAVADALGNTPAICRKYYIHPLVIEAYHDRSLFSAVEKAVKSDPQEEAYALSEEEKAVAILLQGSELLAG